MRDNAVCITGIGAATPLGNSLDVIADNLLRGVSATRKVFDRHGDQMVPCLGTAVDQVPTPCTMERSDFRQLPRMQQMAAWCGAMALDDAQLLNCREQLRVGVVLGLGGEWYRHWEMDVVDGGTLIYQPDREHVPLVNFLQSHLNLMGPTASVAAACASGNYALAQGRRWVEQGLVDICLAGSCEIATPITRANFTNLRATSRRIDDAEHASRPFDIDRDGFVMGEGAAVFVLEPSSSARRRGARIFAEIAGFGATSDASHMIIPSDDPRPAAGAMRAALADAGIQPSEVDYINAHGTSTPVGDRAETRSLKLVFGSHTATTPVSSTKSMTGHLLSASAAVEAIACIAAMEHQAIPPTINLDQPDPECDLCHVPHQAVEQRVRIAMSNSFGFGGSNTTLVLRKAA